MTEPSPEFVGEVGQASRLSGPALDVAASLDSQVGQASRLSSPPPDVPTPSERAALAEVSRSSETGGTPVLPFKAFERGAPVAMYGRHLPHWNQSGCTYFVTFRLGDSIPKERLRRWEAEMTCWLRAHPEPRSEADRKEFHEMFTARFHAWLDAGDGACWLRRAEVGAILEACLRHFDAQRYVLGHFVIMPNHVHVMVTPVQGSDLSGILHSWKSFSVHQVNRLLNRRGKLWQDESFDHIVRNEGQLVRFERYIVQNPIRARLKEGEYRLGCGSGGVLANVGLASRLSSPAPDAAASVDSQVGQASRLSGPALDAAAPSDRSAWANISRASGTGGTPVLPP